MLFPWFKRHSTPPADEENDLRDQDYQRRTDAEIEMLLNQNKFLVAQNERLQALLEAHQIKSREQNKVVASLSDKDTEIAHLTEEKAMLEKKIGDLQRQLSDFSCQFSFYSVGFPPVYRRQWLADWGVFAPPPLEERIGLEDDDDKVDLDYFSKFGE